MHSVQLLSAMVAVGAGVVSAASSAAAPTSTCTGDVTITQPTPTISCGVVDANIIVDSSVAGALTINGPVEITGDLLIVNATELISISSSTIQEIGGNFTLNNLVLLSSLDMQALNTLNSISFVKLPQLSTLTFGSQGVTKASDVEVADTFLGDLSGLNIQTVDSLTITNNAKLTTFNSELVNITTLLSITSNGNDMEINMTQLQTAAEIHLSNIKSFDVPSLSSVSGSIKFDTNEIGSFSADNLTNIGDSVTFINNNELVNISFPVLTKIGDFTIQNNTALETIDGFPKLTTITGGMILRGNFSNVTLPSLNDVKGGVTVTSTTDISSFCDFFNNLKTKGDIQGQETCTSNNVNANSGGNGGTSSTSSSKNGTESAAGAVGINMAALGLAVFAGMAQLY